MGKQTAFSARYGLPSERNTIREESLMIRGSLDIRETCRIRSRGKKTVSSKADYKSLDNPISRIIVATYYELKKKCLHWDTITVI